MKDRLPGETVDSARQGVGVRYTMMITTVVPKIDEVPGIALKCAGLRRNRQPRSLPAEPATDRPRFRVRAVAGSAAEAGSVA